MELPGVTGNITLLNRGVWYTFFQINWTVPLRSIHFTICKLCFNENINNKLKTSNYKIQGIKFRGLGELTNSSLGLNGQRASVAQHQEILWPSLRLGIAKDEFLILLSVNLEFYFNIIKLSHGILFWI